MWIQCQRHLICNNTYADLKEKIFKNRHEYRKKCKHMIVLIFNLLLSVIIKNMLISDISCTVKGFYLYFVTEYIQKIPTYLKPQGTLGGCQFSASQSDFCPNINQLIKKIKSYLEFKFECNYHLIFIVKIKICIRQY